eukprot:scaffold1795_cov140-Isochrysis_galbana.AAC.5
MNKTRPAPRRSVDNKGRHRRTEEHMLGTKLLSSTAGCVLRLLTAPPGTPDTADMRLRRQLQPPREVV